VWKDSSVRGQLSEGGPLSVKSMVSWQMPFKAASVGLSSLAASWPSLWVLGGEDEVVVEELEGLFLSIASTSTLNEAVIRTDSGAV